MRKCTGVQVHKAEVKRPTTREIGCPPAREQVLV